MKVVQVPAAGISVTAGASTRVTHRAMELMGIPVAAVWVGEHGVRFCPWPCPE